MKEEWRAVTGYDGFYEVSNFGRVRNLAVYSYKYKRVIVRKEPRLINPCLTYDGYLRVVLSKYGKKKHFTVHRLVALVFLPNNDNLPEVNHKDENHKNNCVWNLEWCTRKYNANYGTLPKRISEWQTNSRVRSKAVFQYTLDGEFISAYPSQREAGRVTGINSDTIGSVCRGTGKTAGGFKWSFAL